MGLTVPAEPLKIVVVTSNGFLTTKDPNQIKSDDVKVFEGTEEECVKLIHGGISD